MTDEPSAAGAAGNVMYPDGGNNPAGNLAGAIDPATGQPKFSAAAVADPAKPAEVAPAADPSAAAPIADPAKPAEEPAKPGEVAPLDLAAYADLKLPEGLVADEALFGEFKSLAAEAGIPPEAATKLLPFAEKLATAQLTRFQEAATAEFSKQQGDWVTELKSMPEFQGEALERNTAFLGRLMDEFGSPEARAYLDSTGAGNNPAIVKMLLSMGQALVEGDPTPVGDPGRLATPKPAARGARASGGSILYPDLAN